MRENRKGGHPPYNEYKCIDCGKKIQKNSTRCADCAHENRCKLKFSKEEMEEMIQTKTMTEIWKENNVTRRTLVKKLEKLGLPSSQAEIDKIYKNK